MISARERQCAIARPQGRSHTSDGASRVVLVASTLLDSGTPVMRVKRLNDSHLSDVRLTNRRVEALPTFVAATTVLPRNVARMPLAANFREARRNRIALLARSEGR